MSLADLARCMELELGSSSMVTRSGKVVEVIGTLVRATGLEAKLGELCNLLDVCKYHIRLLHGRFSKRDFL